MNLAQICNVNTDQLDKKITTFLETDIQLPDLYKNQLFNLLFSSGKRMRPIFTVLGSYFGECSEDEVYNLAAIFELIHTASLIHDDIIDKADIRRGTQTLHIQNGVYNTLILGNYLVALSAEYISNFKFEDFYYDSFNLTDLCESEINQQALLFNYNITFDEYIYKTKNKTALLIAASLLGGAKLANADKKTLNILYNYAINLGISFQITDDILDFTQDKLHLGKPHGADLINGNITLPVIFALRNKTLSEKIKQLSKQSSINEFNECIELILKSDAIKESRKVSQKYISKARNSIRKLQHSKKEILMKILEGLEQRTY